MNQSPLPENLIDVLSDESFAREHLPGARNFCVYETAFLGKVEEAFPAKDVALVVYGLNDVTRETAEAVVRLNGAGYENVTVFSGGLEGWKARGGAVEGECSDANGPEGRFEIVAEESFVRWTGRNLFNFHEGTLKFKGGFLEVNEGRLTGGELQFDFDSLRCLDIADGDMNAKLIAHLRSDDFFALDRFSEVALRVTGSELLGDVTSGMPNLRVEADLLLRGETRPVEFFVTAAARQDGAVVAQGSLQFDRTLWGAIYGSGKFFARLGMHVVNDLVDIQVKVVAK
jgi:rhodanese-related sulfurtransferase/polyisoprenoid-binding protein YceI